MEFLCLFKNGTTVRMLCSMWSHGVLSPRMLWLWVHVMVGQIDRLPKCIRIIFTSRLDKQAKHAHSVFSVTQPTFSNIFFSYEMIQEVNVDICFLLFMKYKIICWIMTLLKSCLYFELCRFCFNTPSFAYFETWRFWHSWTFNEFLLLYFQFLTYVC